MKASGIIRKLDDLGRITIAKETRDKYNWEKGTPLEAFLVEDGVLFKAYRQGCYCCNTMENLKRYNGLSLCKKCSENFK